MTVPKKPVFDGNVVKVRCEERRVAGRGCVVDGLRFTLRVDALPDEEFLPDLPPVLSDNIWDEGYRLRKLKEAWEEIEKDAGPAAKALQKASALAARVAAILSSDFRIGPVNKGHDFYRWRLPILFNGQEVAAVHAWSASASEKQAGQRATVNVYIHGGACTFATPGWERRMYTAMSPTDWVITRVDLAVDLFDGLQGGIESVYADYQAGGWDHLGKRPKPDSMGWCKGHSRSLYFGDRYGGKQTNWYEKGDQLFGHDEAVERGIRWLRCELRYGNKLRFLEPEMLIRPGDFFAGASAAHERYLRMAEEQLATSIKAEPEAVKCHRPDALMHIEAECARVVRWVRHTAGAALKVVFDHMTDDQLTNVLQEAGTPRRLRGFGVDQVSKAFLRMTFPGLGAANEGPPQGAHLAVAA